MYGDIASHGIGGIGIKGDPFIVVQKVASITDLIDQISGPIQSIPIGGRRTRGDERHGLIAGRYVAGKGDRRILTGLPYLGYKDGYHEFRGLALIGLDGDVQGHREYIASIDAAGLYDTVDLDAAAGDDQQQDDAGRLPVVAGVRF